MEVDSSTAVTGKRRHHQGRFYAVLEGHRRKLMVNDVVVRAEYAFAVVGRPNGVEQFFLGDGRRRNDVMRPAVGVTALPMPAIDVVSPSAVRAGLVFLAVQAIIGCVLGLVFLFKEYEVAHGRNAFAGRTCIAL